MQSSYPFDRKPVLDRGPHLLLGRGTKRSENPVVKNMIIRSVMNWKVIIAIRLIGNPFWTTDKTEQKPNS